MDERTREEELEEAKSKEVVAFRKTEEDDVDRWTVRPKD